MSKIVTSYSIGPILLLVTLVFQRGGDASELGAETLFSRRPEGSEDFVDRHGTWEGWRLPPRCPGTDSCQGRCGNNRRDDDYTCHCDSVCQMYGDCCVDVQKHCSFDFVTRKLVPRSCVHDPTLGIQDNYLNVPSCPLNVSGDGTNEQGRVLGEDGVVYSSMYCARYYGAADAISLTDLFSKPGKNEEQSLPFMRTCFQAVDICNVSGQNLYNQYLEDLCATYQGPVKSIRMPNRKRRMYKNAYCALCNGDIPDLRCPTELMTYSRRDYSADLFESSLQGKNVLSDGIPSSFSILLNFGLDGVERYEFSAESREAMLRNQQRCPGGFLWDPFSELCRQLYCGTQFVLINSRCIEKPMEDKNNFTMRTDKASTEQPLTSSRITVIMNVSLENDAAIDLDDMKEAIIHALEAYNVSRKRVRNLDVTITWDPSELQTYLESSEKVILLEDNDYEDEFNNRSLSNGTDTLAALIADFDLYEPKDIIEPSINTVIGALVKSHNLSSLLLKELNVTGEVHRVEHRPTITKTWCTVGDGGIIREYWNEEFILLPKKDDNDTIGQVYVKKTDRTYGLGNFAANVLFRITSDQKGSAINVVGVVVVCDRGTGLPKSCPRLDFNLSQVEIFENNSLLLFTGKESLTVLCHHYKLLPGGRVRLCLDEILDALGSRGQLFNGPVMAMISLVLSIISMVSLALVLFTYILFSQLRNLPGWNIILLTGTLFFMHLSFLLSQRQSVQGATCRAAAIVCHYSVVNAFFWMNVLAFDLYKTFNGSASLGSRKTSQFLPSYAAYAFGMPLLIVGTCVALDYADTALSPSYGLFGQCWIVNRVSALAFFAVPMAVLLLVNFVFYVMTVYAVHTVTR